MQGGDQYYVAAPEVTREFCIIPSKPSIQIDSSDPTKAVLTSSATSGNKWFLNGTPVSKTTQQIEVTTEGSYTVQVDIDGCVSPVSTAVNLKITGLEYTQKLVGFPNPVSSVFYLTNVNAGRYVLTDMSGRSVGSGELSGDSRIDFTGYATGLYILLLESDEQVYRIKISKE